MTGHRATWVNAFTDKAVGGNPCIVVFDAGDIPEAERLDFTRATGLTECAFLQPSDKADFGARYYTAKAEIKFAGHPTIATITALEAAGALQGRDHLTLEVGSGVIPIGISRGDGPPRITMTQARPVFGATHDPAFVAEMMGLTAADIVGTPQVVSTGTPFCIAEVRDHAALRRARIEPEPYLAAEEAFGPHFEPFLVALGGVDTGDTFSRLMLPPPLPPEDAFTGSATGCMSAYLFANRRIGSRFTAEQGHWMGRPSRANAEVVGTPDAIHSVRLSGQGIVLMDAVIGKGYI
ncbi:MAG: PhzF family phenazine biosynthesis protein [Pseudomonadota bacterium]